MGNPLEISTWGSLSLQNSASPIMEQFTLFHHHTSTLLMVIIILMLTTMFNSMYPMLTDRLLLHAPTLETVWTLLPLIVLLMVALPSLQVLYLTENSLDSSLTLKATAHQWYWSYNLSNKPELEMDSYMTPISDNPLNRLLDTDNNLILPTHTTTRIIVTSTDVIHSWTIPALGLKSDAVPGRLNQLNVLINRPGLFFGQCSEICGINHSFMPIKLEAIPINKFIDWFNN